MKGRIPEPQESRRDSGVQSLDTGLAVLDALASQPRAMMLKEVAQIAGMPPAKAHRYLVSFVRCGYVNQEESGRYTLGGAAVRVGLSALARLDPVRAAIARVEELVEQTGHTALVSVWGTYGPTVVYWRDAPRAVTVRIKPGSVLPLLTSATGRVFAAFLDTAPVAAILARELEQQAALPHAAVRTAGELRAMLEQIRHSGLGVSLEEQLPGVKALSAPVFNRYGRLELALTIWGNGPQFDVTPHGAIVSALQRAAAAVSADLGHDGRGDGGPSCPARPAADATGAR